MTVTITSTSKIITLDGLPVRIWEGTTESGIKVHCFVNRVAVFLEEDQTQFQRELQTVIPPSREVDQAYFTGNDLED